MIKEKCASIAHTAREFFSPCEVAKDVFSGEDIPSPSFSSTRVRGRHSPNLHNVWEKGDSFWEATPLKPTMLDTPLANSL